MPEFSTASVVQKLIHHLLKEDKNFNINQYILIRNIYRLSLKDQGNSSVYQVTKNGDRINCVIL